MPGTWLDIVRTWVLKVPGLAILAALVFCIVLIAVFLFSTPPCESRSFLGITSDRTRLSVCARAPDDQAAPSAGAKPPAPTGRETMAVPPPVAAPPASTTLPDISFDASGREDFRKRFGLAIVEVESAVLAETPGYTFGFAYGGSFATVWKDKLGTLTIRSAPRSVHFEVQKRGDGTVYIVGFMRGDSAKELQFSRTYPEKIRLYSERYKSSDAIVAIPVQMIRTVGQSTIDVAGNNYIPVLDLGFR